MRLVKFRTLYSVLIILFLTSLIFVRYLSERERFVLVSENLKKNLSEIELKTANRNIDLYVDVVDRFYQEENNRIREKAVEYMFLFRNRYGASDNYDFWSSMNQKDNLAIILTNLDDISETSFSKYFFVLHANSGVLYKNRVSKIDDFLRFFAISEISNKDYYSVDNFIFMSFKNNEYIIGLDLNFNIDDRDLTYFFDDFSRKLDQNNEMIYYITNTEGQIFSSNDKNTINTFLQDYPLFRGDQLYKKSLIENNNECYQITDISGNEFSVKVRKYSKFGFVLYIGDKINTFELGSKIENLLDSFVLDDLYLSSGILLSFLLFLYLLKVFIDKDFKKMLRSFEKSEGEASYYFDEFAHIDLLFHERLSLLNNRISEYSRTDKLFSDFIDQVDEFIIIKSLDDKYVKVNKKFRDLVKLKDEQIVNKTPFELGYDIEFVKKRREIEKRILETNMPEVSVFSASLSSSLGIRWLEEITFPILDENGKIIYIGTTSRDITDRKQFEEKIKLQHKELEEAYENLKKSQSIIINQEKLASIGVMLAGIAHEINNPLHSIKLNFSSIMLNYDEIERYIRLLLDRDIIKKDSENISVLEALEETKVLFENDMKNFSRIENIIASTRRNTHQSDVKTFENLNTIIDDSIMMLSNKLTSKVRIIKVFDDNLKIVKVNRTEISQVIFNLLSNSIDAIISKNNDEKGMIIIETLNDLTAMSSKVRIIDNGTGIKRENIGKLFDPFFTTKPVGKGTGLGLNIVYRTVSGNGGKIGVESKEGAGSKFEISFPTIETGVFLDETIQLTSST
ncbi:MAG: PAS domain S-box protein [Candidatus Delongbacteria bacterium]|nr:PAS domain S-box protein [Candidatus Delongbacteria bacterium]MBN2835918.1 PAS domain S-box protein [Candidatus Delongbacteria bacterium]